MERRDLATADEASIRQQLHRQRRQERARAPPRRLEMDDGLDERLRPLRVVFDRVDINRSGHIDWAELVEGVRAVQAFAELLGLPRKQHRHLCNAHETPNDGHGGGNAKQLAIEDDRDSGGSAGSKSSAEAGERSRSQGKSTKVTPT